MSTQISISSDEIANLFQRLYPEQFNRVVAEIKALKYEQMYLQTVQASQAPEEDPVEAPEELPEEDDDGQS